MAKDDSQLWLAKSDQDPIRKKYAEAVKNNEQFFTYKDNPVLTSYAKYLIEYWDMQKPKK